MAAIDRRQTAAGAFLFSAIVISVSVPIAAHALAQDQAPFTISNDPNGDIAAVGGSDISVVLPLHPGISQSDVDRYSRWLVLSNEQHAFVVASYERYRKAFEQTLKDALPQLRDAAKSVETLLNEHRVFTDDYLNAEMHFIEVVSDVNQKCEAQAVDVLFNEITHILADAQLEQFTRVRMDHDRRRIAINEWAFAPARVDFEKLIERFGWNTAPLDPLFIEYEQRLTPLVRTAEGAIERQQAELAQANAYLLRGPNGEALDPTTPAGRQAFEENVRRKNAILERAARAQLLVHRANKEFLPRFLSALPQPRAELLLNTFRETAYQWVYPDRGDLRSLYKKITTSGLLSEDESALIEVKWNQYRSEYQRVCDQMEDASDNYFLDCASTESEPNGESYHAAMKQWESRRWDLDERMISEIKQVLQPRLSSVFKLDLNVKVTDIHNAREQAATHDRFP